MNCNTDIIEELERVNVLFYLKRGEVFKESRDNPEESGRLI